MEKKLMRLYEMARRSAENAKEMKHGVSAERREVYRCVSVLQGIKRLKFSDDVVDSTHVARRFRFFTSHRSPQIRRAAESVLESWKRRENSVKKKKAETWSFKTGDESRDNIRVTIAQALWRTKEFYELGILKTGEEKREKLKGCDPYRVAVCLESALFEKLGRFTTGPMKKREEVSPRMRYRSIMQNFSWADEEEDYDFRIRLLLGQVSSRELFYWEA